ncbi:methyltransferase [Catellatospora sp. NPDC049609]|uniref:methyltransferase n=1 Tax=Catellatospora sp. NPDC049609 TaxID=3155505 RepID=UPI00342CFD6C
MGNTQPRRWQVAAPLTEPARDTSRVELAASHLSHGSPAGRCSWFHEVMETTPATADAVDVWPPAYRGKALVKVLAWLVTERLAGQDAWVTWHMDKQQGPDSIGRMLEGLGWTEFSRRRELRMTHLRGRPPATAELPQAAEFSARIGATDLVFEADYGVFSPRSVDDGTALLAEVALAEKPVQTVADIGVGYGPLAIALVRGGVATDAVATDIDSVALWLARRNAVRNGVTMTVTCDPDPLAVPPTALTVCNVPTHIDAAQSRALMSGLITRSRSGRLLIVVHRSLEGRYAAHLKNAGLDIERHPGPAHTVLAVTGGE